MSKSQAMMQGVNSFMHTLDWLDQRSDRKAQVRRQSDLDAQAQEDRTRRITREDQQHEWALEDRGERKRAAQKAEARADQAYAESEEAKRLTGVLWGMLKAQQEGRPYQPQQIAQTLVDSGMPADQLQRVADPRTGQYAQAVREVTSGQRDITPQDLELFNWRHEPAIKRSVGRTLDADVKSNDGQVIPKGSKIVDARAAELAPSESGNLYMLLEVTAQTPDGRTVTYLAPRTKDATRAGGERVPHEIPVEPLLAGADFDNYLSQQLQGQDLTPFISAAQARLVQLGRDPSVIDPGKAERLAKKEQKGLELVEAQIDNTRSQVASRKTRDGLLAQRARAGGSSGGKMSADQALIHDHETRLFAHVKDPAERYRKAVDSVKEFKRAAHKSKSRAELVDGWARMLAQQNSGNVKKVDPVAEANRMVEAIYGKQEPKGGESYGDLLEHLPDSRGEYVTRDDDGDDDLKELWGEE